jgi:hypothetical protein
MNPGVQQTQLLFMVGGRQTEITFQGPGRSCSGQIQHYSRIRESFGKYALRIQERREGVVLSMFVQQIHVGKCV